MPRLLVLVDLVPQMQSVPLFVVDLGLLDHFVEMSQLLVPSLLTQLNCSDEVVRAQILVPNADLDRFGEQRVDVDFGELELLVELGVKRLLLDARLLLVGLAVLWRRQDGSRDKV